MELLGATYSAMDIESSKTQVSMSLLEAIRGLTGLVGTRNRMLDSLTGLATSTPDLSAIDTILGAYSAYQDAQAVLLAGGVLHAGAAFAQQGAFALRTARGHHGIPLFLGGHKRQWLYYGELMKKYHPAFTVRLGKALQEAGFPYPNIRLDKYHLMLKKSGRQGEAFRILEQVASDFDAEHGTNFLGAFWANFFWGFFDDLDKK